MPVYDYECKKCGKAFTVVVRLSEIDPKKKVRCPKCSSTEAQKRIEPFFAVTAKKS